MKIGVSLAAGVISIAIASASVDWDEWDEDYSNDDPKSERVVNQSKGSNTPRDNKKQNEQSDKVTRDLDLKPKEAERLHRDPHAKGLDYKQLLDYAKSLFK